MKEQITSKSNVADTSWENAEAYAPTLARFLHPEMDAENQEKLANHYRSQLEMLHSAEGLKAVVTENGVSVEVSSSETPAGGLDIDTFTQLLGHPDHMWEHTIVDESSRQSLEAITGKPVEVVDLRAQKAA